MKKRFAKWAVGLFVLIVLILFKKYNASQFLTLDYLKSQQLALATFYTAHPLVVIGSYMGIYIGSTALSLPGATLLTLAGGAIFGFWTGLLIVSFASTIGATFAFLVSRFLLRDYVQNRFSDKLKVFNEGVKKEGALYLFSLRLIPVFPFFLVNLTMGLSPIGVTTFFFVSQLGMLAGTAAYVNAGTQLSKLQSLKGIVSPQILFSFVVIGLLPFFSKKIISWYKSSKKRLKFKKPSHYDYNLVVIGAGSGGLVSAYIAAAVKAKVLLIEKNEMGGDCLNTGCVPSKSLIKSAKFVYDAKRSQDFGISEANLNFDFAQVMERIQKVIKKISPHDSIERYTSLGVECLTGSAKITDPYTVAVGTKKITTKNIIIAAGARPLVPAIPGLDKQKYFTSDTIWGLRQLPKRFLILGGGPIGCELAQAFARFGSEVTIVEMGPQIMGKEDGDVADFLTGQFKRENIKVLTKHKALRFLSEGSVNTLVCENNGVELQIQFDELFLALGRKANIEDYGIKELKIEVSDRGTIVANEFMQTNYPNIFACGDVTGPYQFTHVAAHQAWYASVNALFQPFKRYKADYRVIPWCTFTDPEVARVGLSENDAKEKKIPHGIFKYDLSDLDRAIAEDEDHGFLKVLVVPGSDKILGVTIVGAHAGDLIIEFVSAMKFGIGLNKILSTIHIYPTFGEANKYLAGVWKKATAPKKALKYLEKFHGWRR